MCSSPINARLVGLLLRQHFEGRGFRAPQSTCRSGCRTHARVPTPRTPRRQQLELEGFNHAISPSTRGADSRARCRVKLDRLTQQRPVTLASLAD
jgi:hypothetical protein